MTWPQLEALGVTAWWGGPTGRTIEIEAPVEQHEAVRDAIYARVPRLRITSCDMRVPRGICTSCALPIGRDKLGWCPLCTAAWIVVIRERDAAKAAALPPAPVWRAA